MNGGNIGRGALIGGIAGGIMTGLTYTPPIEQGSGLLAFGPGGDPVQFKATLSEVMVTTQRVPVDLVRVNWANVFGRFGYSILNGSLINKSLAPQFIIVDYDEVYQVINPEQPKINALVVPIGAIDGVAPSGPFSTFGKVRMAGRGRSIIENFETNTSLESFTSTLESNGYIKSLTSHPEVYNYSKGPIKYSVRPFSKEGPPTAEYYINSTKIRKIRIMGK